jgi:hypothetical protein
VVQTHTARAAFRKDFRGDTNAHSGPCVRAPIFVALQFFVFQLIPGLASKRAVGIWFVVYFNRQRSVCISSIGVTNDMTRKGCPAPEKLVGMAATVVTGCEFVASV